MDVRRRTGFRRRYFLVVITSAGRIVVAPIPSRGVAMTRLVRFVVAGLLVAAAHLTAADALPPGAVARLGVARPHWDYLVAVAFRPDGTAVTADDNLNVIRWDLASGRILDQR